MNVGHNNPRVVEAISEQVDRFLHTDFTVVPYEGYVELAERLGALAPIGGETRARSSTPAQRLSRTPSRSRASIRSDRLSSCSRARSTAAPGWP